MEELCFVMAPQRGHARDPAETVLTVARIMDCLTARGAELHEAAGGDDDGSDHDDSYGDDGGGGCGGELGHHEGGGPGLEDERLDDEAYDPRRGRRGTRRQEMARFRLATVVYAIFDDRLMRAAICKAVPAALGLHPNAAVGILMACLRQGRLPWWHSLVLRRGPVGFRCNPAPRRHLFGRLLSCLDLNEREDEFLQADPERTLDLREHPYLARGISKTTGGSEGAETRSGCRLGSSRGAPAVPLAGASP